MKKLHKPLSLNHQRADRRRKKHSLIEATIKTILHKANHDGKAECYIPDEGRRFKKKNKQKLNEVEIGNLPEKRFQIMIVKMIQDLGGKNGGKG